MLLTSTIFLASFFPFFEAFAQFSHGSREVNVSMFEIDFAGYGKMPDYEQVFVDFFQNLAQVKYKKRQHCK